MGDDLVVSSTTDSPEQIKEALQHGIETEAEEPAAEAPAAETAVDPPAAEDAAAEPEKKAPAAVVKEPDAPADDAKVKKEKPKRAEFKTDSEFNTALEKFNVQKRIDKLTWEKGDERRKREAAETELATLKASAVAGRKLPAPSDAEKEAVAAAAEPEPKAEDFETHEDWQAAVRKHEIKAEVAAQFKKQREDDAAAHEKATSEALHRTFVDSKADARSRYPDFDSVLKENADMPVTGTMAYAMVKAGPLGHDMSYYLATHRDEADRIADMGDTGDAAEAMGELKATVRSFVAARLAPADEDAAGAGEDESTQEGEQKPAAKVLKKDPVVSKTPNPINPVGGRAANSKAPLDNAEYQDYKARREQEETARRKQLGRRR